MISSADFVFFQLTNLLVYILFVIIFTASIIVMPEKCSYRRRLCFDHSREQKVLASQRLLFKHKTAEVSGGPMCRGNRTAVIRKRDGGHCMQVLFNIL